MPSGARRGGREREREKEVVFAPDVQRRDALVRLRE